jgi:hypothetical protein
MHHRHFALAAGGRSACGALAPLLILLCFGLIAAAPARANLIVNGGFDGGSAGWNVLSESGRYTTQWRGEDATGAVGSGSLRISHHGDSLTSYQGASQCVEVEEGASYPVAARFRIPPGQPGTFFASVIVYWGASSDCTGFIHGATPVSHAVAGAWALKTGTVVAPAAARGALVALNVHNGSSGVTVMADFDDIVFGEGTSSAPAPPYATWITSSGLPGFEAQVRIRPSGSPPIQGAGESDCVDETLCAHGALSGRPEVFVKVIGPRPNGWLWAQIVRFTPSRVEIWLRRQSTLEINYYDLAAIGPGAGLLTGLEDRQAFLP